MKNKHKIAVDMIDSRFLAFASGGPSAVLHAETSMAIEMAYALGAISFEEHSYYVARRHKLGELEHNAIMACLGVRS